MIASRQSGVIVEGNMSGESYAAGIDDENMPWVIQLFTDLYSDPPAAVVREYATNASDAQVEAGVDGPIEITLPTALAPFYKVKDRGVGLSADDIRRIYSRYGSSTKRGTNDQNGMLGMGCKSALAYCSQFTVESVKDGMRTVCSISREESDVPVFTVVASVPDDSENGTEVIVPVQRNDHQTFATAAATFFSYWPEGSVIVNGVEPEKIDGLDLGNGMILCKKDGYVYGRVPNMIVMGNVAYPVDEDKMDLGLPTNYWLVATVDIGAVEFVPSREALNYNKITMPTLAAVKARMEKALAVSIQVEIDKAANHREAIQLMLKYRDLMGGSNLSPDHFKFKGEQMPQRVGDNWVIASYRSHKQSHSERVNNGFGTDNIANALVVTGYTNATFTATTKKKLIQYVEDAGIDVPGYFALCEERPDSKWITDDQVVTWDDIKAVKLSATSSNYGWRSGRPTGSYDAYIGGKSQHIQAAEIDQDEPVYYGRSRNKHEMYHYAEIIGQFFPDATVVCLPENRYAKFARNFPDAKNYRDGLQAAYDKWAKSLTKGQRLALAINDKSDWDAFSTLDPTRVDDPAIRKACRIAQNVDLQAVTRARRSFNNVLHAVDTGKLGEESWDCPLKGYRLLTHMTYRSPWRDEHIYLYLNAAYAAGATQDPEEEE